jgi:hypothetical protein
MKMESAIHDQKIIMPLEEALELGESVIKVRATGGRTGDQSDEYEYHFLDIPEILEQFNNLPNNEYDRLGYGIEYVGYRAYLVRTKNDSELEVKCAGCLKDHPNFTRLVMKKEVLPVTEKNRRTGKLFKTLKKSADQWFKEYPWLEKGDSIKLALNDKKYLDYDETKKLLDIDGHRIRVDDYVDKYWRLAILSSCPWAKSPKIHDYPDIHLGIPESVMHGGQDKPYAVLNYTGLISLENQILRDLVKPKSIGNGVVVMNEDRIPKYLKRRLRLQGNQ